MERRKEPCDGGLVRLLCALDGGLNLLYLACMWLAGSLLVLLCLLVLYGIVARIIGAYSGGASDVAGYVMASASFLAMARTFRTRGHIHVSLLVSRLPSVIYRRARIVAHIIMFLATAYVAVYMSRLVYFSYQFKERSEGADAILLWLPQLPVAFGAAVFAVAVLHSAVDVVIGRLDEREAVAQ